MPSAILLSELKSNKNIKNYKESSRYGLVLFVYLLTVLFLVVDKNTVRIYNVNNKKRENKLKVKKKTQKSFSV